MNVAIGPVLPLLYGQNAPPAAPLMIRSDRDARNVWSVSDAVSPASGETPPGRPLIGVRVRGHQLQVAAKVGYGRN